MARGRLVRLLGLYLVACGVAVNVVLLALVLAVAALGPRAALEHLAAAWHDARTGGEALVQRFAAARAERRQAALGLAHADEAGLRAVSGGEPGAARVLAVGPGRPYAVPSAAARDARPGDVIEIDAGTYRGDSAQWRTGDLVIRGRGGIAVLDAGGTRLVQDKAIWLVQGDNVRIENVAFSGARSRDRNGAGIRAEGDRLHVVRCYFRDNETGILSNPVRDGQLTVERSEFARNGHADGQAHQIYVNPMARFELRYSYLHDAFVGSAVKSRARFNLIAANRIVDGAGGSSNYSIDLSEGGRAVVVGNEIEQGPLSGNGRMIAFAPERPGAPGSELFVVHNTLVNDRYDGVFVWNNSAGTAYLYNNLMIGGRRVVHGRALTAGNVFAPDGGLWPVDGDLGGDRGSSGNRVVADAGIGDRGRLDYRLRADSVAVDSGAALAAVDGLELEPEVEYVHPLQRRAREAVGAPDAGAHELPAAAAVRPGSPAAAGD